MSSLDGAPPGRQAGTAAKTRVRDGHDSRARADPAQVPEVVWSANIRDDGVDVLLLSELDGSGERSTDRAQAARMTCLLGPAQRTRRVWRAEQAELRRRDRRQHGKTRPNASRSDPVQAALAEAPWIDDERIDPVLPQLCQQRGAQLRDLKAPNAHRPRFARHALSRWNVFHGRTGHQRHDRGGDCDKAKPDQRWALPKTREGGSRHALPASAPVESDPQTCSGDWVGW